MPQQDFSYTQQLWLRLRKNRAAVFGLCVIVLSFLVAVFGYVIAPDNTSNADLQTVEIQARKPGYTQLFLKIPNSNTVTSSAWSRFWNGRKQNYKLIPINSYRFLKDSIEIDKYIDEDTSVRQAYSIDEITGHQPEIFKLLLVKKTYWLGTDKFGRDILSRLIIGTRVSLAVGLIAVLISLTLGILLGALAGYYRGWVDEVIMWLVNVTWSIPTLLLVFAITMTMGKGFWQIFIAVGLTMWVSVARLVRGQVLAVKEMEFIQASKALGLKEGTRPWVGRSPATPQQ